MTSTVERDSNDLRVVRRGRRRRVSPRQRWVLVAAAVVLGLLAAGGVAYVSWLGGGLLSVSRTVQDDADVAQKSLRKFRTAVTSGDQAAARQHLRRAEAALDHARDATRTPQVRAAKWLPYTRGTVADMDHLLNAAGVLVDSAGGAMTLYSDFSGDGSTLFRDGQFNLKAVERGRDALLTMTAALDEAESELEKVHGDGPMGDDALDKKRTGLKQVRELQAQVAPFRPIIDALPSAVGAEGVRRYLVAIMNPAEMRGSGGAPLSMAMVVLKNGKLTIPLKGTASDHYLHSPPGLLGDSPELVWKRVKGDPFQPPLGEPVRFVNTGFNPDFRVSGEQMMRSTPSFFGMRTDGVIALDVVALSHLLEALGPVESEYGTLTPANLVDELLVKAYDEQGTDVQGRQARNDQLMTTILTDLTAGGGIQGKVKALAKAIPARHLQMYFRDDRLQSVVRELDADGAVPAPKVGNLTAVYTQNGNGSKVDVFQQRTIDETITLKADGSALVRRTVTLDNRTPPYRGLTPDIKRGYLTRWATNLVINLMPPGARVTYQPTSDLPTTVKKGVDQDGRTFAQAAVVTEPAGSSALSWEYVVPHAAVRHEGGLRLTDRVVTQNTVQGLMLRTTVNAPEGWTLREAGDGQAWYLNGGQAFLQIAVAEPLTLRLDAYR